MLLLNQMIILFLMMLVGYICRWQGLLNKYGSQVISGIVVNVANPALILSASINSDGSIKGKDLLYTAVISAAIYVFLILISFILPRILGVSKDKYGVYKVMTVFSNIGFMGFPLISAVYGSKALLYASIFLLPYNLLIYTWGIHSLDSNSDRKKGHKLSLGKIFNIGVIACILTMIIYLANIQVPEFVSKTVKSFSELTAPLSMMVIGASMFDMKIRDLVSDIRLIIFTVIKLLIIPALGIFIIKLFVTNADMLGVCLIMLATPVGSMTAMLAGQYECDYELCSRGVALSTVLSVLTIPLVSAVML